MIRGDKIRRKRKIMKEGSLRKSVLLNMSGLGEKGWLKKDNRSGAHGQKNTF